MTVRAEGGRRRRRRAPTPGAGTTARRVAVARPPSPRVPVRDPGHRAGPGRAATAPAGACATGRRRPRRPSAAPRPSGTIEAMTVPGRVEAASLLLSLDPPPWFVRHARAVAEVAGWLAARIEARGIAVDRRLVEAAALLHDADKALPADDPARAPPARRRLGGLADPSRSPGAGAGRREPPGDPPRSTASGTAAGRRSRRARNGSSPTPTSAPASGSSRWRPGSPRGAAATRGSTSTVARSAGTRPTCAPSGRAPTGSRPTSAAPPGSARTRSAGSRWTGPALAARPRRRRSRTSGTR